MILVKILLACIILLFAMGMIAISGTERHAERTHFTALIMVSLICLTALMILK